MLALSALLNLVRRKSTPSQLRRRPQTAAHNRLSESLEPRQLLTAKLVAEFVDGTFPQGPEVVRDYGQTENNSLALNGQYFFASRLGGLSKITAAGKTELLLNPDPGGYNSQVSSLTASAGRLFFSATDSIDGQRLWTSDGTPAGTRLLQSPTADFLNPTQLTDVNGTLFFVASDPVHGFELWKSDGTDSGTQLVLDILPGSLSSSVNNLTNVNGILYFTANQSGDNTEIWTSNGTPEGTIPLTPATPGAYTPNLANFTAVGNQLYYTVDFFTSGMQLWTTDGTPAGTSPVRDSDGNPLIPVGTIAALGNSLIFAAEYDSDTELWQASGTAATLLKDIQPGPRSSNPAGFVKFADKLYFSADDGLSGSELWQTDGTALGTVQTKDLNLAASSTPTKLLASNDLLYFTAEDEQYGQEVWRSDGTAAGTWVLADTQPSPDAFNRGPVDLRTDGYLLFFISDSPGGHDLVWRSNGSSTGTTVISDTQFAPNGGYPSGLARIGQSVIFAAHDNNYTNQIWLSDGTTSGTVLVRQSSPETPFHFARNFTSLNGKTIFSAFDENNTEQLWVSDGTTAGTQLIKHITPKWNAEKTYTLYNNYLYFAADDGTNGSELWRTDGTEAGTSLFADIAAGPDSGMFLGSNMLVVNGILYFTAADSFDTELWRTDGTEAGTFLVRNIDPYLSSNPHSLTEFNNRLFFVASHVEFGDELWTSDGTADGTYLVRDINPGFAPSFPYSPNYTVSGHFNRQIEVLNNQLLFTADDGLNGFELWTSDGTEAGTSLLIDINPGNASSNPSQLTRSASGDTLYFQANDGIHGRELYVTDGTPAGTRLLLDIQPGPKHSEPDQLLAFNDILLFAANDGQHGTEVWQSDGTPEGTQLLSDTNPGINASFPGDLIVVNNTLLFSAVGFAGAELYGAPINHRPSDVFLSDTSVIENLPAGTVVGQLSASDPDKCDTVTFTLASGNGDKQNQLFVIHGNTLKTTAPLDFETLPSCSIRIRATDAAGQFTDRIFQITVENSDDAPTLDEIPNLVLREDDRQQTVRLSGITAGPGESQPLRIITSSSNPGLIPRPAVVYFSPNPNTSLTFTPTRGKTGTSIITVTVEDGGTDGILETPADNKSFTRTFLVTVLATRPVILSPLNTTTLQQPLITWTTVQDAVAWQVWIGNASSTQLPRIQTSTQNTHYQVVTDIGIGLVDIYVRGVRSNGSLLPWSLPARIKIDTAATIQPISRRQATPRPTATINPLPGAARFETFLENRTTGQSPVLRKSITSNTWTTDTDLQLAVYWLWTRGVAADGTTARWSSPAEFIVTTPPQPLAPTSSTFNRQPTFTWSTVPGANSYGIQVRNSSGTLVANVSALPTPSWTPSSPLPDGTYTWIANAENTQGKFRSDWSRRVDFHVGGRPLINAPSGTLNTKAALVQWNPVAGAASFNIWVNRVLPGQVSVNIYKASGITSNSITLPVQLENDADYRVWLQAVSTTGEVSVWSLPANFSVRLTLSSHGTLPSLLDNNSADNAATDVLISDLVDMLLEKSHHTPRFAAAPRISSANCTTRRENFDEGADSNSGTPAFTARKLDFGSSGMSIPTGNCIASATCDAETSPDHPVLFNTSRNLPRSSPDSDIQSTINFVRRNDT